VVSTHLASLEYTVVSGLASGIDTAAHQAALRQGNRTLAVLGTGLNRAYPPANAGLQAEIARRGAVISQFEPDAGPDSARFRARNVTMAALSRATVIIEAGFVSGVRVAARAALGNGRLVFLARGVLEQPWAAELAGRPGVHVFDRPQEITDRLERLYAPGPLTG
jgi:DNA processing protein